MKPCMSNDQLIYLPIFHHIFQTFIGDLEMALICFLIKKKSFNLFTDAINIYK